MKLAILDRDGTLNASGEEFISVPEEWVPVPGVPEAVARLTHAGWRLAVATNQPGLGRGLFDVLALNAIHARMHRVLAAAGGRIEAVFYCPHAPDEGCACRKPAPGLMEQIRERYGVEGGEILVVGNCPEHLWAGAAIGARLHAVGAPPEGSRPWPPGVQHHASLAEFADQLLAASERPPPAGD
ncbi:D-glycero-alpha-D-manno-heptose-1,7-bisphosphate 7-phosphatase [Paracidovorax avenae]|uniref:D-glycero-alpha-D-manno-heptose-1,7-bisphosphate 7-phosphatase n=1 Tax=Paracidovorax avenae TaxID=80867 RepID=UPI0006B39AE3|nr:HAD-IIIA family hydrolase [Paracidovorax avenae]